MTHDPAPVPVVKVPVTRNPYLPAPPDDGKHVYSGEPSDIGGNQRCSLCGAYKHSPEASEICQGEYRESGKMRAWAREKWADEKAVPTTTEHFNHPAATYRAHKPGGVDIGTPTRPEYQVRCLLDGSPWPCDASRMAELVLRP